MGIQILLYIQIAQTKIATQQVGLGWELTQTQLEREMHQLEVWLNPTFNPSSTYGQIIIWVEFGPCSSWLNDGRVGSGSYLSHWNLFSCPNFSYID